MENFLAPWRDQILSLLRIMTGLCILQFGTAKLLKFPAAPMFKDVTLTTWPSGYAGILELVFGTLLTIGLFSRPAAFILSGLMAFAYFLGHAGRGFYPLLNGGTLAFMFSFACLYLAAAGAGPLSLDAMIRNKK
jgi:putative oxidoreductase